MKLTYTQLREILGILITSDPVRATLGELFSKGKSISELEILDLIYQSNIDSQIIAILGYDPETIDAIQGMEVILSFFAYIRGNSEKFSGFLSNFAFPKAEEKPHPTN